MNQAINLINEMIKEEQDTYDKCFVQILQEAKKRISSLHSDTQWIDVKTRLPESDGDYLISDGESFVDINWYCSTRKRFGRIENEITHWANIPFPPNN